MSRDMEGIERMRDGSAYGGKPPEQMSPQELHSALWQVLRFRDKGLALSCRSMRSLIVPPVVKSIENTIGKLSVDGYMPYFKASLGFF